MRYRPFVIIVILLMAVLAWPRLLLADEVLDLYFQAKSLTMQQDWDHALELYNSIIEKYPSSQYYDESRFWIGYCFEKKEKLPRAFAAFAELIKDSPNSSWRDDALQHQIDIAEKLVHSGNDTYRRFLNDMLNTDDSLLQLKAAMALARNGLPESVPYLESIPRDEEFWQEAQVLLSNFKDDSTAVPENNVVQTESEFNETARQPGATLKPDGKHIRYYAKQRFAQYQKMTKSTDDWTYYDLMDFGYWHILRTDVFDYYNTLNQNEKEIWARKFWFTSDPTPTTEINEARQEFERRVLYARDHYNYYDNLPDHFYAPWDARGEIYIKYGAPHSVKVRGMEEYWYYPQYKHLQFMIRRYVTNIFGRAIFSRYGTNWSMWGDPRKLDTETLDIIYQPVFIYNHKYIHDQFDGLEAGVKTGNDGKSYMFYTVPAREFKVQKDQRGYYINYTEKYAIYNSSYFQIQYFEMERRIDGQRNDLKQMIIKQEIPLDLAPGTYYLGVRVDDKSVNKMSTVLKDISIQKMEP